MNITSEGEELVNKSNLRRENPMQLELPLSDNHKTIKIIDTVTGRVLFSITGNVCAVYEPGAYSVAREFWERDMGILEVYKEFAEEQKRTMENFLSIPASAHVEKHSTDSVKYAEVSAPHDGTGYVDE